MALDLPLKIIAWEDEKGKVWLAYNESGYLIDRYGLQTDAASVLNLDKIIDKALEDSI